METRYLLFIDTIIKLNVKYKTTRIYKTIINVATHWMYIFIVGGVIERVKLSKLCHVHSCPTTMHVLMSKSCPMRKCPNFGACAAVQIFRHVQIYASVIQEFNLSVEVAHNLVELSV